MRNNHPAIKGFYLLGIYICLLGMTFIYADGHMGYLAKGINYFGVPILILFFRMNTAIDTRFAKHIFYGLILFAISCICSIAVPIMGKYSIHLTLVSWIVAYTNYSKALISITSMSSSILYKKSWIVLLILIIIVALHSLLWKDINLIDYFWIPISCLALINLIFFMASVNLYRQLSVSLFRMLCISAVILFGYNCLIGVIIYKNSSIFDSYFTLLFYLGQLLFMYTSVRASIHFKTEETINLADLIKQ